MSKPASTKMRDSITTVATEQIQEFVVTLYRPQTFQFHILRLLLLTRQSSTDTLVIMIVEHSMSQASTDRQCVTITSTCISMRTHIVQPRSKQTTYTLETMSACTQTEENLASHQSLPAITILLGQKSMYILNL
ncbi:hypothetical protein LTR05_004138 [Lithohypha guttulata]|uniref:Uncharacterized protein n=1 Tax=Lithohypha guttulata TaxID=1690604 RepID=A0AAN7T2Z4_9EURO|nr:hypothetical protein LTR05_004138 [Lithohypha guttulata]